MEVKRIFDIPYYSKTKYTKDDYLCDKRNGKWEKVSTDQYLDITNQLSRALLKYGLKKGDKVIAYARVLAPGVSFAGFPGIGRVCVSQTARRLGLGVVGTLATILWMWTLAPPPL
mgnify:CR=1 FL=1